MAKMVTITLDDESEVAFKAIPRGKRSKFIRAVIMKAERVTELEELTTALKARVRELFAEKNAAITQLNNYKLGLVEAGWVSPESRERVEE